MLKIRIMREDLPCQDTTYYKATIIKTCIAVLKGRSGKQNRSPKTDPGVYDYLVYNKVGI